MNSPILPTQKALETSKQIAKDALKKYAWKDLEKKAFQAIAQRGYFVALLSERGEPAKKRVYIAHSPITKTRTKTDYRIILHK